MATRTIKQRLQEAIRKQFEGFGIKTWRICRTRNECAMIIWMACNRARPEDPEKEYRAIAEAVARIRRGTRITPVPGMSLPQSP